MAEPLKRSQLIQQQIEDLRKNVPPALNQAERDQIMKGRKGQVDIDAGRQAISDRERAISDHATKIDSLIAKYDSAVKDETTQTNREGDEKTRQEREANASPLWNTFIPAGAGAAGGAAIGETVNRILHQFNKGNAEAVKEIGKELGPTDRLTNSLMNRARATGAATAAEKYAPSSLLRQGGAVAGRGLSYGIPAGIFANEYSKYAERAADPNATEADRMANQRIANGLLGVATGIGADGGMRFFFPSRHEGEGEAMMRINTARDYARRMDQADADRTTAERLRRAGSGETSRPLTAVDPMERLRGAMQTADAPPSLPPPQSTPQPATRNSATLINAAKASGASGRLNKASAAEHLIANINDSNRGAIAKALGVSNGPNLHSRVLQAIKTMASKPGASAVLAGIAGGTAASTSPAEAGDGSAVSGLGDRAIAGGTAAGSAYGLSRLVNAMKPAVGTAISAVGTMMTPTAISDAVDENAHLFTEEGLEQDAFENAQTRPAWARKVERFFGAGDREEKYRQMAQVPERGSRSGPMSPVPEPAGAPMTPIPARAEMENAAAPEPPQMAPAEASPPPSDDMSEFDQLVTASQQDPELAAMLRDAILARVQQANEQQVPNALASQAVASRGGDPMAAALRNFAQR